MGDTLLPWFQVLLTCIIAVLWLPARFDGGTQECMVFSVVKNMAVTWGIPLRAPQVDGQ